jgi:putative acetyltransferase
MAGHKSGEIKRVLCEIVDVRETNSMEIQLSQTAFEILKPPGQNLSSNYGPINLNRALTPNSDFGITIGVNLAHKLGISKGDFIEIFNNGESLFFIPILKHELRSFFYHSVGADNPRVILLSSHAEFEPFTREVATQIHHRLEAGSIPSRRIEAREQSILWHNQINATISRYDVDITRNKGTPERIGTKLVNKNLSYRILSEMYFQLISQYLSSKKTVIVMDIHGIATQSSTGIIHPMIIVGDAFARNPLVEKFTNTIRLASKSRISDLWIVYRPPWGSVEHSLQLVKKSRNIPVIIEIRRDLRDDPETRDHLITLISRALEELVEFSDHYLFTTKKILYRRYLDSDLEGIRKIYIDAYQKLYGTQAEQYADQFLQLFKSASDEQVAGELFVAEKNNRIKGFAVIHEEPANDWKFGPIAVKPLLQHKGIGSQLLQLCIDFARSQGVQQFYLKVHEHNHAAIKLYEKFGFKTAQTFPSDIDGKNFLKMVLDLRP